MYVYVCTCVSLFSLPSEGFGGCGGWMVAWFHPVEKNDDARIEKRCVSIDVVVASVLIANYGNSVCLFLGTW